MSRQERKRGALRHWWATFLDGLLERLPVL